VWRSAGLDSLTSAGRKYRVLYTSGNSTAISAAVLAGLAVTVLAESALRPGMRVLSEADGFPRLPSCEIGIIRSWNPQPSAAIDKLAEHIVSSLDNLSVPAVAA
jgi:DNA-binding transcriptional LysR family regulator